MSRLTDLIREAKRLDPGLGGELEKEVRHLQERRAFGLNFERHQPEAVDLYGRPVRVGDKVRMLPPRGETVAPDKRLWVVTGGATVDGQKRADLRDPKTGDTATHPVDDLVVVAENTDVIYPGLVSTGKVERGGDKPFHTVINAENLHALEALLYTHRGKVDVIYIDPPYNTGAKDWKYNNDYVEGDDLYRHSKWLAFMERRLKIAKELLHPDDSVLIVTIDEKEYLRLGMLLEQAFPAARLQMVSIAISPSGGSRERAFRRSDEYAFFVKLGNAAPSALELGPEWQGSKGTSTKRLRWNGLMRSGTEAKREDRESMFYPILLDADNGRLVRIGQSMALSERRQDYESPRGTIAVWPIRTDGSEGRWQVGPSGAEALFDRGFLRVGRFRGADTAISYLKLGEQKKLAAGVFGKLSLSEEGHVLTEGEAEGNLRVPTTQWSLVSHSAADHGSSLLRRIIPARKFPFPKSLYAVEDTLRFFVRHKAEATILDFFAGSGTTAHAVMRLNKQDDGRRRCISVTNNEAGVEEQRGLRQRALRPGDPDWEALGICDYITKPRIEAAITGRTPSGEPIKGDYKFTDEFPMADGFEENVEFFTLTYEAPLTVSAGHAFARIAPLLWLRAGSRGRRIENLETGWDVAEAYGVIERLDGLDRFVDALRAQPEAKVAFIVTDDERRFQSACAALPERVEPVRLYESYLRNFQIDAVRSSR